MKIVAKPIDAVVLFEGEKIPRPHRFRCRWDGENEEPATVKVDYIFETERVNLVGAPAILYRCQSQINGVMKPYELRYLVKECRWELYKI